MGEKSESGEPDKVFVLRFWGDPGSQPAIWQAEVKELGTSRRSDKRFKVSGLTAACKIIAQQLKKSIKRE